jgi:hypothetical protein
VNVNVVYGYCILCMNKMYCEYSEFPAVELVYPVFHFFLKISKISTTAQPSRYRLTNVIHNSQLSYRRLTCVIYDSPISTVVDNELTYGGPSVAVVDNARPRLDNGHALSMLTHANHRRLDNIRWPCHRLV